MFGYLGIWVFGYLGLEAGGWRLRLKIEDLKMSTSNKKGSENEFEEVDMKEAEESSMFIFCIEVEVR